MFQTVKHTFRKLNFEQIANLETNKKNLSVVEFKANNNKKNPKILLYGF